MRQKFAVCFAGVPGSSKTIVANYLSGKFGLPVFNSDQLRYEVCEDYKVDNINIPIALKEFEKRLNERVEEFLKNGRPIILDGSVDRRWEERKDQLAKHAYDWFLINMEFSRSFLVNLFNSTGRADLTANYLDKYMDEHAEFINKYSSEISLNITDKQFSDRLKIAAEGLSEFLDSGVVKMLKK